MSTAHSQTRALAAVLKQQTARTATKPGVRGARWRMGTVQTVGSDGTITTTDGIVAKRLESYSQPAAGDIVAITGSGTGSWVCWGRLGADSGSRVWLPYNSAWTAATTNPNLGNASLTSVYSVTGKTCHVAIRLIPGSTTTFGSGGYLFGVPFASAPATVEYLGVARLTAGSTYIGQTDLGTGGSSMSATFPSQSTPGIAANMSPTAPATFANGHTLRMQITYQIA